MKLPPGKIPVDILKDVVFKNLGVKREEVAIGPTAGVDGAVIDIGDKSLVVSMDPITGANERIGWLAVNVNANDIATFGVEPAFLFSSIYHIAFIRASALVNRICSTTSGPIDPT